MKGVAVNKNMLMTGTVQEYWSWLLSVWKTHENVKDEEIGCKGSNVT